MTSRAKMEGETMLNLDDTHVKTPTYHNSLIKIKKNEFIERNASGKMVCKEMS